MASIWEKVLALVILLQLCNQRIFCFRESDLILRRISQDRKTEGLKIRGASSNMVAAGHNLPLLVEIGLTDVPKALHSRGRQTYFKHKYMYVRSIVLF